MLLNDPQSSLVCKFGYRHRPFDDVIFAFSRPFCPLMMSHDDVTGLFLLLFFCENRWRTMRAVVAGCVGEAHGAEDVALYWRPDDCRGEAPDSS